MTTPSKAAREKARELIQAKARSEWDRRFPPLEGKTPTFDVYASSAEHEFARYIDEVSEIVGDYVRHCCTSDHKRETALRTLILPDEPDPRLEPLAEALSGIVPSICAREGESAAGAVARMLLEELDKSGSLKIVEAGDD